MPDFITDIFSWISDTGVSLWVWVTGGVMALITLATSLVSSILGLPIVFALLRGMSGVFTRLLDSAFSRLNSDVKIIRDTHGRVTAQTTISNRGVKPKRIEYAFLLIAPEQQDPLISVKLLHQVKQPDELPALLQKYKKKAELKTKRLWVLRLIEKMNHWGTEADSTGATLSLMQIWYESPVYTGSDQMRGVGLIPLKFYHQEQQAIGNEEVHYRCNIETSYFRWGEPYSVRFYVYRNGHAHRLTQDLMVL